MQAADAFGRAHRATLDEKLENFFDLGKRDSGTLNAIGGSRAERLLALHAAKALSAVSVGSEPLGIGFAGGAGHVLILQQAYAVVNAIDSENSKFAGLFCEDWSKIEKEARSVASRSGGIASCLFTA